MNKEPVQDFVAEGRPRTTLHNRADYIPYDKRKLSYANTFKNPWKANAIRAIEWLTAKPSLLWRIRRFEQAGVESGPGFWPQAVREMGIEIGTPAEQINRIPKDGPLVVVANHPHGLVDGMIMAELIGRARSDYKILTRSLLTGIKEIEEFMIPVAFPHEDDAQQKNLEMRRQSMQQLKDGGVVILFPAGVVASSTTWFGRAVEQEWNPFTAKMILRSGATVLPIYFPGQNSRWYQIANLVSATIRQGLLLYEIRHALGKPQSPVIGNPIPPDEVVTWRENPRGFMAHLRERTLALRDNPDA
ncbi:MAG: lysophospholipid acyltransferase family protein [Pseudomonadota bacterium]